MDKIGFKCITCGEITYLPGIDGTLGVKLRETTQCLECARGGELVNSGVQRRILAKYASGEY